MIFTYILYNSILIFTMIFSFMVQRAKNKQSELLARGLLFLTLTLFASIRKGIGTDYWSYVELYKIYNSGSDEHEMGFQWLGQFLNYFGLHYQWFIAALVVLTFLPLCFYIPKKRFFYFITIYFFLSYFHIISTSRQDISLSIMICGIFSLYHKHGNLKYLICAVLATLFHFSSVLYFPLIFLKTMRFNNRVQLFIILGIIIIVGLNMETIMWLSTTPVFVNSKYGIYFETGYFREASVNSGLGILFNLLIPILYVIFNLRCSQYIEHSGFFTILAFIYIFSCLLSSQIHILGRIVSIFQFVPAFLVYPVCKGISKKYYALFFMGFVVGYILLFEKTISESQISLGNGMGISPFTTIFNK